MTSIGTDKQNITACERIVGGYRTWKSAIKALRTVLGQSIERYA